MRAAGPAPAATRPALANGASSRLQSLTDRVLWLVAAAALGALLLLLGVEHYWLRDLKFDDAYIHFRYAENIARGEGFVYNPGERVLGSGAVPWNLMLAVIAALVPAGTLPAAVSVLNYLALLACAALLLAALRELVRPWLGMAITAALLAQGPLVVSSVGGMETVFLCVLYLVTFLALLRQRYLLAGLAAGAAVCFRLESVFLAGVTVLAPLLHDRRQLWRALGATLLLPLLVYLWAWAYFGFPIANSTMAKRIVYRPPPLHALRTCLQALADGLQFARLWPLGPVMVHWARDARVVLWLPFLCLGYLFVRRRAPAAALVVAQPLGALAFYGVSHPLMFPWYMCTFAPLASLFALLGVAAAGEWVRGPRVLRAVATLAAIVCLSWRPFVETWPLIPPTDPRFNALLPNAGPHARVYQYAAIARWLNARVQPAERVCLSEIGALGYYYHGRVLDGLGLVSPEALRYHPTSLRPSLLSGDVREQIQPADAPRAGALPPALVHDLRPEYVVSMDIFAEHLFFADPWFQQHYALIGRWPWYAGPVAWHDLPARAWGGVEMRAYHRLDAP